MGEVLPQSATERAKLGFPVPVGHWLAGEWYGYAEELLRAAQTDRWVDRKAALGLLRGYGAGEPDVSWRQVWSLMVFSIWHQILRRAGVRPGAPRLGAGPALISPAARSQAALRRRGREPVAKPPGG